ncbi:hypothetical protein [Vreelandella venusta]|uniref:hypothetical protein n=1 Tax=Vreelandella venusta TaxID=44935 RepID=UPI0018DA84AF|nr:hypothetical protein [Halomonas venusta]QPI65888.1 hypothetical protein IR195_09420 [Halomonas venusta]
MIDAILYINDVTDFSDEDTIPEGANYTSGPKALIYTRTKMPITDERVTVLAEAPYIGTGTADRVYAQIQNDTDALALYESVYDTSPREVDDGEGGTQTITPPFKFGMLAESVLSVPESVSSRQGMEQLIRSGLDEQVDDAINGITDPVERKLVRNWLDKAGIWERYNPQLLAIGNALALSEQDVDCLFIQAARL